MSPLRRSRREEFDEMFVDAVGRFLLQVVAGGERLRIDEVARELAPHRRKLLGRRRPSRSPQYQEGHSDLAAYFEGAATLENYLLLRQGGITRWPGSRFIAEVKNSTADTILWPFEFSSEESYVLEVGDLYVRVYKNKARVLLAGVPVEVVTSFVVADIRAIHFTQSADVLFLFHGNYAPSKLSRTSDTSWTFSTRTATPPPSFQADTNLATTLGVGANTGTGIKIHAGGSVFLAGDVGRQVIAGAGRAVITALDTAFQVTVDILDPFAATITAGPNPVTTTVGTTFNSIAHGLAAGDYVSITSGAQAGQARRVASISTADVAILDNAFPADIAVAATWNKVGAINSGAWALRLSPQTTLDPNLSAPAGSSVTFTAGVAAFRAEDVGKFVMIYGGVAQLTVFTSSTSVRGQLLSVMGEVTGDPAAASAGNWTLEVASWSVVKGYPRSGEFYQGRLYAMSTTAQPASFWGSRSDDFDNYAVGIAADDAVEHTVASRQVNRLEWMAESNKALFIGTSGSELKATGSGGDNAVIGGNIIPLIERIATNGVMAVQPAVARRTLLYPDRSRRKIFAIGFDIYSNGEVDQELTLGSEHITESGVRLEHISYQKRLTPRLLFCREDGTLVSMTYYPEQKVSGFTRRTTQGTFESKAVIPVTQAGDQIWAIVKRTINGVTKRYVECFEENHELLSGRAWTSLQTDCAIVVTGITGVTITGLGHLEAATVDVVKNGKFIGAQTVTGASITVLVALVPADVVEIGLHYDSTCRSMRPAVPGQMLEGIPRSWNSLFCRLHRSLGGSLNGSAMLLPASNVETSTPYTGDVKVTPRGWDTEGRITIAQTDPYPQTVLCAFGTLELGAQD